jgi:uncharacterized membrane protein
VNLRSVVRLITAVLAVLIVGLGIWAFVSPQSFYEQIATYPPYNKHLFHDVGSFQIGIGSTLLYALIRRDALQVALVGASIGAVMHAISHIMDRNLGGKTTDPILLSLLALAIVVTTAMHLSTRRSA